MAVLAFPCGLPGVGGQPGPAPSYHHHSRRICRERWPSKKERAGV